jgi:hypothetical protein
VAQESCIALLVASEEMAALRGFDVLMSIAEGELCSTDERGMLTHLPGRHLTAAESSSS